VLIGLIPAARAGLVLLVLVLRAVMDVAYVQFVSGYAGFNVDIDVVKLGESYLITLMLALVLPSRVKKPSDFLLLILFLVPVLPCISFYALSNQSRMFFYAVNVSFIVVALVRHISVPTPPSIGGVWKSVLVVCAVASVGVALWLLRAGGAQIFNLDITRVYEYRQTYNTEVAVGLFSYISRWTYKVLNVLLMGWALFQRWFLLFLGLAGLQLVFFGLSTHKQLIAFPALVLFLYIFIPKRTAVFWTMAGMLSVVMISLAAYSLSGHVLAPSLLIRRLLYLPAELNFAYYDFFSSHGLVYLTNSRWFAWLGTYGFDKPPPLLISDAAGLYGAWANTGFLSAAYMHFGIPGMLVWSFLVGLLLKLTDNLTIGRLPVWLALCIVIVPFTNLFMSSDLLTALFGDGLILALLLLWLFNARPAILRFRLFGRSGHKLPASR
jgi:hypothetical protein